jgi:hypothetical protein
MAYTTALHFLQLGVIGRGGLRLEQLRQAGGYGGSYQQVETAHGDFRHDDLVMNR